MIFVFV